MTNDKAAAALRSALQDVAPDVDLDLLDPRAPFQEEADIDSMDFLNVVIGLHDITGIDIPEADYPKLATVQDILGYLEARGVGGA